MYYCTWIYPSLKQDFIVIFNVYDCNTFLTPSAHENGSSCSSLTAEAFNQEIAAWHSTSMKNVVISYIVLKVKLSYVTTNKQIIVNKLQNRSLSFQSNSSPTHNGLICTKHILRLCRFMIHRKLNWCLFSTKLLNITRSGISGSACWDTLKQGLHEPCTIYSRQIECQRLLSTCDLSGQTHI